MPTPETFAGSSTLLWLRTDRGREVARAYWAGPHGALVAGTPGMREYRQHHHALASPGRWPDTDGVETRIPEARRVDGMPEVTFLRPWSPLLGGGHFRKVHADEQNVFARTTMYMTTLGGARWFRSGDGAEVGARAVVLLRRRGDASGRAFRRLVHEAIGPALDEADGTSELRTQTFLPYHPIFWNTPNVAHDNPPEARFHAAIVVGARDERALHGALTAAGTRHAAAVRSLCAAVHAYDVMETYVYRRAGAPVVPPLVWSPRG